MRQLSETFGAFHLHEITPMVVDAYVAWCTTARAPATVNRAVQIRHQTFRKAMEWGQARENPVRHQKPLRADNRRLPYLSYEEICRRSRRPMTTYGLYCSWPPIPE